MSNQESDQSDDPVKMTVRFPKRVYERIVERKKAYPHLSLNAIVVMAVEESIPDADKGN